MAIPDSVNQFLFLYPAKRGVIGQVYNDLAHAQKWKDLDVVDLPLVNRCGFTGSHPMRENGQQDCTVVPCSIAEDISVIWLQRAFQSIKNGKGKSIYIAVVDSDSTVVYYKISQGLISPPI